MRTSSATQARGTKTLPLQLFIDKANVSRLDKRSIFPVILYLLCFSRKVRRTLGVNVAFIPIIGDNSIGGRKLSRAIIKKTGRTVLQATLRKILKQVQKSSPLRARLPSDNETELITPVFLSIVAARYTVLNRSLQLRFHHIWYVNRLSLPTLFCSDFGLGHGHIRCSPP